MTDLELRELATRFAALTDALLAQAEAGGWDALSPLVDERDEALDRLIAEAGDRLLDRLPDLRPVFMALLDKNQRIDALVGRRQETLAVELAPARQQRRLNDMYRS
ncbi:flagellar protein FliT [Paludibacterium paludis]|uniref:Flagellar protein FliT n=1 Tax=Paludibacterium paludis TaxID=1225769 RepID=A0A918UBX8_9NEIS|nr:flagellar protein FliT [Paludibacterium paludis]GGY29648.1 hypothetical protein GCM10011289_35700 [Paludibacterium paludis]